MTERTDKNTDNSAGSADEGSTSRITLDELEKRLAANPRFKRDESDEPGTTTVTLDQSSI